MTGPGGVRARCPGTRGHRTPRDQDTEGLGDPGTGRPRASAHQETRGPRRPADTRGPGAAGDRGACIEM
ncbi:hypothetical protein AB852_17765 [Streptomyces uncialis]|uniref:Uncharacterized protein n=1 Tax=Streptomyces uncialis TaxID=1048205 RepID=A0A1Q4V672_9ACTN|nr:hypothetical protein AB852_17765 [Streptomyces uncialis]